MNTKKDVQLKKGDTLVKVANEYLGDYRRWREFAHINKIKIFDSLPTGKNIKIPTREELREQIDKEQSEIIASAQRDIKERLKEIADSREIQSITKILGVDANKLIEDLDLSPLAKKLPKASSSVDDVWQLISWVL